MYLLRAYHEMFENKVIELENEALKVFKKCYRLYIDKKDDILKMCQHFKGFASSFQAVVNGEASTADTESFLSIIRMERPICECCPNLRKTHGFCIETLFVLGKFFEAQFVQQELSPSK